MSPNSKFVTEAKTLYQHHLIYQYLKIVHMLEVNIPCKNIFLIVFAKFPVFPLSVSGKTNIQTPSSLIYVDATKLNIEASHKNMYGSR